MAKKKPELNPKTDTPQSKSDITKNFMLGYIKEFGSAEDKEWFKKLVREHKVEKVSALDNKPHNTLDIVPVRTAFCERFFNNLNKTKTKADDWFDEVENL